MQSIRTFHRLFGLFLGFPRFGTFFLGVPFYEFFHSACGIHDLLFAGEERMAFGTQINRDLFHGGSCFHLIAAGTGDDTATVFRMNLLFHHYLLIYSLLIESRNSLFVFVLFIFSIRNSICSMTFISERNLRRIHNRLSSCSVRISSSFLVPDL